MGWLGGIRGIIGDCCALKRGFSEAEAESLC